MNLLFRKTRKAAGALRNNLFGWKTRERILVIESDDWGSIRIPSRKAYAALQRCGLGVEKCPFLTYDRFEREDDFSAIFDLLSKFRGSDGRPPILTANFIMANPDFARIRESEFSAYYRKPFVTQLEEWGKRTEYFRVVQQGADDHLIKAQLHGMEHVNVPYWMRFLKDGSSETRLAFDLGIYGVSSDVTAETRRNFLAAFDYEDDVEFEDYIRPSLVSAHSLFLQCFGFKPETFIAPNYFWNDRIEELLGAMAVRGIQSARNQRLPFWNSKHGKKSFIKRHTGQRNRFEQRYLVRNVVFEPSAFDNEKEMHLADCMRQIEISFLMNSPAIVSMHRLNFMGGFDERNRSENLILLEKLLNKVTERWPDVIFMSSDSLLKRILCDEELSRP